MADYFSLMNAPTTIPRSSALRDMDVRETPDGKPVIFSITFYLYSETNPTRNGEEKHLDRAISVGPGKMSTKDTRRRGVVACNPDGRPLGHIIPVHIDFIKDFNNQRVTL